MLTYGVNRNDREIKGVDECNIEHNGKDARAQRHVGVHYNDDDNQGSLFMGKSAAFCIGNRVREETRGKLFKMYLT